MDKAEGCRNFCATQPVSTDAIVKIARLRAITPQPPQPPPTTTATTTSMTTTTAATATRSAGRWRVTVRHGKRHGRI